MTSKYGAGNDPACYPGTDVLRNKLGIRDPGRLQEAEAAFAATAAETIEVDAPPFNLDYLRSLHRQLFDEVYEWAGDLRTVDISKGYTRFCIASRVAPEAEKLLSQFDVERLSGMSPGECVRHVAELYGELNMIHPFREGNGRTQRLLFEHWLLLGGYTVSWLGVGKEEWVDACIAAVSCDYLPLERIFERCIGVLLIEE